MSHATVYPSTTKVFGSALFPLFLPLCAQFRSPPANTNILHIFSLTWGQRPRKCLRSQIFLHLLKGFISDNKINKCLLWDSCKTLGKSHTHTHTPYKTQHAFCNTIPTLTLQYSISFCCTMKWISYMYIFIPPSEASLPLPPSYPSKSWPRALNWASSALHQVPT